MRRAAKTDLPYDPEDEQTQLYAYFHELIERRRLEPTDDLIGTLIASEIDRGVEHHLAFGHGAHYCIGAALARLMGRVAFEELTTRLGDAHVDVARGRRLRAAVSRGWDSLPIAVRGAAGA